MLTKATNMEADTDIVHQGNREKAAEATDSSNDMITDSTISDPITMMFNQGKLSNQKMKALDNLGIKNQSVHIIHNHTNQMECGTMIFQSRNFSLEELSREILNNY
jgi:hypothetical protein